MDTAPGFGHLCRNTGVKLWVREKGKGGEHRRRVQDSKGEKRGIKGRAGKGGEEQ